MKSRNTKLRSAKHCLILVPVRALDCSFLFRGRFGISKGGLDSVKPGDDAWAVASTVASRECCNLTRALHGKGAPNCCIKRVF